MTLICHKLPLALVCLSSVFWISQNVGAQIVPVYVVAAKFGVSSDSDAYAKSVANYYVSANAIAKIPRAGRIVYKIEAPQTTIYPNDDGTFDAVSNGFIWLGPADFEFEYCAAIPLLARSQVRLPVPAMKVAKAAMAFGEVGNDR